MLEKFKSCHHDPLLEVSIVRRTQGKPQGPIEGQRARRADSRRYLAQQTDRNGGDT